MDLESPRSLLGRLKIGREEFCQRLLTMLILEAPYPRWNTRSVASRSGLRFLRALHDASFTVPWPGEHPLFVDEFELPARHDEEAGGGPDQALLWDHHLWLIELKTERGSHRPDQIPGYFELAHHHYPDARIDLLYITPPMDAPAFDPPGPWGRYAHTTWPDLAPLIRWNWPPSTHPACQELVDGLLYAIDNLHLKPAEWRTRFMGTQPESAQEATLAETVPGSDSQGGEVLARAMEMAGLTASDGQQRSVDFAPTDLEDLLQLRVAVRNQLAASPADSPLRHIEPWIWKPASTGRPLTAAGEEVGMELRLSRHKRSLHCIDPIRR